MRVTNCGVCHSDLSLVERHVPVHGADRARPRGGRRRRGVGSGRDVGRAGRSGRAHAGAVVQRVLLVFARRVRVLRARDCRSAPARFLDGRTPLSRHGLPILRGVGLGGFAEYVITPASGAVKVADDTPLEVACVIGCAVQTGVGAVLNTARCPRRRDRARRGRGRNRHRDRAGRAYRGRDEDHRLRPERRPARQRQALRRHRRDRSDEPGRDDCGARAHVGHRRRQRVRSRRRGFVDRDVHLGDAQRRHHRDGRRRWHRPDRDARAAGDVRAVGAQADGVLVGQLQRPARHSASARALARGPPRSRRT